MAKSREAGIGGRGGGEADSSRPRAVLAAGHHQARPRALLRVDRRPRAPAPRRPADVPGPLSGGHGQGVLLPEAHGHLGARGAPAREDQGEDQGRRVPRGRRSARAHRARPDRHPRDPHVELGGEGARAPEPTGVRPRPRSRRRVGARRRRRAPDPRAARRPRARELRQDHRGQGPPRGRSAGAGRVVGGGQRVRAHASPRTSRARIPGATPPRWPSRPGRARSSSTT